jgi:hypothetical protein
VAVGLLSHDYYNRASQVRSTLEQRHQRAAKAIAAVRSELAKSESVLRQVQQIRRDFDKAATALQLGEYAVLNLRTEMRNWTINV